MKAELVHSFDFKVRNIDMDLDETAEDKRRQFRDVSQDLTNKGLMTPAVVAFHTHYTHRIIRNDQQVIVQQFPEVAFVQNDKGWEEAGTDWVVPTSDTTLAKKRHMALMVTRAVLPDGCVGVINFNMRDALDFVDRLNELDYCGFCHPGCVDYIRWYKSSSGHTLAVVSVDTESG
jgi:hypothetical protein